jgi:type I restriction enzyme R subunit
MRETNARGEKRGPTEDELALFDALETNDRAAKILARLRAAERDAYRSLPAKYSTMRA